MMVPMTTMDIMLTLTVQIFIMIQVIVFEVFYGQKVEFYIYLFLLFVLSIAFDIPDTIVNKYVSIILKNFCYYSKNAVQYLIYLL